MKEVHKDAIMGMYVVVVIIIIGAFKPMNPPFLLRDSLHSFHSLQPVSPSIRYIIT